MKKINEWLNNLRDRIPFLSSKKSKSSIEEHKREVLKDARRFVYPWQLPKHKSAFISTIIIIVLFVTFIAGVGMSIYRYKSESELVYQVSRIVPFPLGKVGSDYVQYEDYLFELRILKHVHGTGAQNFGREPVSFDSKEGQKLLADSRKDALLTAQKNTLIRQIARSNGLDVTNQEVEERIDEQIERYGGDDRLRQILSQSFGWSERMAINNLRRSYKTSILKQKITPILDEENRKEAEEILKRVKTSPDKFAEIAKEESQDAATAQNGGDLGFKPIEELESQSKSFANAVKNLGKGEISDVVASELGFHIIKKVDEKENTVRVSHIQINYFNVDKHLVDRLKETETIIYGELKEIKNAAAVLHY